MDNNTMTLVNNLLDLTRANTSLSMTVEQLRMDLMKTDEESKDMIFAIIDACCGCKDYEKGLAKKICAILDYDMEEKKDA